MFASRSSRYASTTPRRTAAEGSSHARIERGVLADARQRMRGRVPQVRILVVVGRAAARATASVDFAVLELAQALRGEELHARLRVGQRLHERGLRALAYPMSPRPLADCARTSASASPSSFSSVGPTLAFLRPSCVRPHTACRRASGVAGLVVRHGGEDLHAAARRATPARAALRAARADRDATAAPRAPASLRCVKPSASSLARSALILTCAGSGFTGEMP